MMRDYKTHGFVDGRVVTGILPTGEFGAYREQDDGWVRGYGDSRLAAIADLVEAIETNSEAAELAAAMIDEGLRALTREAAAALVSEYFGPPGACDPAHHAAIVDAFMGKTGSLQNANTN